MVGRTGLQRDDDVVGAAILQVQRMGAALRTVTDDDDVLGLDEVEIGITIVIDAHCNFLPFACLLQILPAIL